MTWHISYSSRARRDLRSLDPSVAERVLRALDRLAETGRGDVQHLQGYDRECRLRVGDWRVQLTFEPEIQTIRVLRVLHRSEAYRE